MSSRTSALDTLATQGILRDLDLHFARLVGACADEASEPLLLAAALASRATGDGHVCVDLGELAGRPLSGGDEEAGAVSPHLAAWREALQASGVVGFAGGAEPDAFPLVLDEADRLYLARYWRYEKSLAQSLLMRAEGFCDGIDDARLAAGLERLFPQRGDDIDWQRVAAAVAVLKRLAVISGGPGTGKTTTVTCLLALLMEQSPERAPRIALAAPTGKAAARLTESIRGAKAALDCAPAVTVRIPEEAVTLHRLLGWRPGGYRHGADQPLPVDVLVVDEASMVDLPMMARLTAALPARARLILLGDKDQLASVEAGNVLGDLCGEEHGPAFSPALATRLRPLARLPEIAEGAAPIEDSVVLLTRSYRFDVDSGIGRLARCVNAGDVEGVHDVLHDDAPGDIAWQPLAGPALPRALLGDVVAHYRLFLQARDVETALEAFNRFRVLCALKVGPLGVSAINAAIEEALAREGLIHPEHHWYAGRPVMVTANDYGLRLYNGDVGLVWPRPQSGRLAAFFPIVDGGLREVYPSRLAAVETCYAMTVHKSQGSEFDEVLIALPGADSPVMTRELLYTGITRARRRVVISGDASALSAAQRRITRRSGLREALWTRPRAKDE